MAGNQVHQIQKNFKDPFNAGQMVGMLVMIMFLENNGRVPAEGIEKLKWICANNAQHYLEKPTEDVFLMIDRLVKEIKI